MNKKPTVKYFFYSYPKKSPLYFKMEKARLEKAIQRAKIEHFGSTAVPGLGGKGVTDIIINVPKTDFLKAKSILEKKGYVYGEVGGNKERFFFRRTIRSGEGYRFVHLHLTKGGNSEWKMALATRDLLREDPKARQQYTKVKKKAVKYAKGDGQRYREFKNKFLGPLAKMAVKKYGKKIRY
jgi:GrpB-like predicted nucleotidyltransferase (UPF0157 family)